jgi:hypothetical protein
MDGDGAVPGRKDTAGKAGARRWFYLVSGVIAALVPIGLQLGLFDTGQGENVTALVATLGSLLGGGAAITASAVTHRQIKAGLHDESDPTALVLDNIPKVLDEAATAQANVDKMRQVTDDLLNGLTNSAVPVGSLTQQVLNKIIQ